LELEKKRGVIKVRKRGGKTWTSDRGKVRRKIRGERCTV